MEIDYSKKEININKELNSLDEFVICFTTILNKFNIKYVLVSGYVSILFGRSRSSEDIDMLIEKLNFEKFNNLWSELYKEFECLNTEIVNEAYKEYLLSNHAIRFSKTNKFIPNMEIKFPKVDLEDWALTQRIKVELNNNKMFISPLELQISFKLFLGSEKDIEDAKHLFNVFRDDLNMSLLLKFNKKLKIDEVFNKYLR